MAKLVVRKGRNEGSEFKLNADRLIMGRRSACPIPILDPKSSREHAAIIRKDGKFFVQDMSRNGTLVNSEMASKNGDGPTPLNYGDKIRIGETILEMVDEKSEPINIQIDGYKIIEKIGYGGMGVVYKAKQLSMDRVVALKVLNEKYSANREFVDRFIREARAAGKLNHPNVIHVHDVSKAGGRHYFSMEYIDGHSVKEMLRINRKLDPEKVVDIALQTAKALEFAHESRIIHRDIKPDNIMLTTDGVVKIADLGIAKMWEEELSNTTRDSQKVMGTPHYMAPEQALGKDIDYRVDIYALGATMYHMLTGTTPFSGNTAHQVLKAHIKDSLPAIQEFAKGVPDQLCFIVERMMAKLPEKRYMNMSRLIDDLERSKQGQDLGMERIPAGDSTIMRAMGATAAAEAPGTAQHTMDVRTGIQTPVSVVFMYSVVAGIFIFLVAAAIWMWTYSGEKIPANGVNKPIPPELEVQKHSDPPEGATNNDLAKALEKKLAEAEQLVKDDPESAQAEQILLRIIEQAPTRSDRAKELLKTIGEKRKEIAKEKARKIYNTAVQFENSNKSDPGKVEMNWQSILADIQNEPDLAQAAQRKAQSWGARQKQAQLDRLGLAWTETKDQASDALARHDFDAARKYLKDFMDRYSGASDQVTEAKAQWTALEEAAKESFLDAQKRTQEIEAQEKAKDIDRSIPLVLNVWQGYLAKVNDAQHKAEADQLVGAVHARAAELVKNQANTIRKKCLEFDFDEAMALAGKLVQQVNDTPLGAEAKSLDAEARVLGELHSRIVTLIGKKTEAGAGIVLSLEFKIEQFKETRTWQITKSEKDTLFFAPLPKTGGPELPRKWKELANEEQYLIYKKVLEPLKPSDQAPMAQFCEIHGLSAQAKNHVSPE